MYIHTYIHICVCLCASLYVRTDSFKSDSLIIDHTISLIESVVVAPLYIYVYQKC